MAPQPLPPEAQRTLGLARVLWAAIVLGQVMFLLAVWVLTSQGIWTGQDPDVARKLWQGAFLALAVAIPLGHMIRMQTYKRHWVGSSVAPQGYLTGNLVLWALCEAPGLLSIVAFLLAGKPVPAAVPAAAVLAVLLVNFPTGRPLRPA